MTDKALNMEATDEMIASVEIDSNDYRHTFYGILNAQGKLWSLLPFETERAADEYLTSWVNRNAEGRKSYLSMLTTHKIVPVRVRLTTIPEGPDNAQ